MPVGAKDTPKAKRKPVATKVVVTPLPGVLGFKDKAIAIIADKSAIPGRAWSDIDRDRVISQFRLTGGEADQGAAPRSSSLIDKVKRREDTRGMTFGFDSGSQNLGPPVDAAARPAEVVAYKLSETSTCNGLMPGVDCSTIGGDDVSVRLALAFNF
ncbi:MAG: hypothetical protein J7485_10505 [Sphingobium sp.]|nr:hypothetical protein [Sphingobium sp.]